jgi:hypothetical protein
MGKRSTALILLVDEEKGTPTRSCGSWRWAMNWFYSPSWEITGSTFTGGLPPPYRRRVQDLQLVHRNSSTEPTSQQPDRGASRTKQIATVRRIRPRSAGRSRKSTASPQDSLESASSARTSKQTGNCNVRQCARQKSPGRCRGLSSREMKKSVTRRDRGAVAAEAVVHP